MSEAAVRDAGPTIQKSHRVVHTPKPDGPIGVFDSGVGGLSVLREIRAHLPTEHLLYVADSAHAPYGDKPPEYVQRRSLAIATFLLQHGAKQIVIGSNTGTAAAATLLRDTINLPVVAMEPGIRPAVAASRSGVIGVLATVYTARSDRFAGLLAAVDPRVRVVAQPAPGLVEQIERGDLTGGHTRALAERYVREMLEQGADTIVLGSTHYVFLRPLLQQIVGPDVTLIDTGPAVAMQTRRVLERHGLVNRSEAPGADRFWSSSEDAAAHAVIADLWGSPLTVAVLPAAVR